MYAIESKKRKLDRLFESLHAPDALQPSSQSLILDDRQREAANTGHGMRGDGSMSSKKIRSSGASSAIPNSLEASNDSISLLHKSRPNYLPLDRDAFLARLLSFRDLTKWKTGKPEVIDEVQWAKRGWSCVGIDRVACVGGCNKQVVVRLAKQESRDVVQDGAPILETEESQNGQGIGGAASGEDVFCSQPAEPDRGSISACRDDSPLDDLDVSAERKETRGKLVERYQHLIVTAHDEQCPWRRRGCDECIHRLPLTNTSVSIANLQWRYNSLKDIESEIPSNVSVTDDNNIDELGKLLDSGYAEGIFTTDAGERYNPQNMRTFALALCGWHGEAGSVPLAECKACFRRLGLWTYQPAKDGSPPIMSSLQAVDEHLDYCPWKNGEVQAGGNRTKLAERQTQGPKPGWALLLHLLTENGRRRIKIREQRPAVEESLSDVGQSEARDSKTKDLVRKVRELTRGFKIKGRVRKTRT